MPGFEFPFLSAPKTLLPQHCLNLIGDYAIPDIIDEQALVPVVNNHRVAY
jgi:hypothetical protein